ncbi:aldehyde dehydrogenase family protein [Meridianimarinicoccus roseus]|uniref:Aldehyde dehydrogenase family protein n=1 Tax=Meridianimarinicoccus roseus TaxID=2072018 RepID=A0A2V2L7L0_9RHOB|nr:aldehyde dehydrogenase family protein [Meridianimarinicoccus roseus]PWR01115.1 aldehyde dehydrogenase family protein [Meridianimarinicoccus roseus]
MTDDCTRFYIGGAWVAPRSAARMAVENPATERAVARIALANAADVDAAVAAARGAFAGWSATPVADRVAVLDRILGLTRARQIDLAAAITAEMGAPTDMALAEQAAVGVMHLEALLDALEGFEWTERLANGDTILREPVGVCGLITPWNWPINQIVLKVLPALAAGCTCVLKPSELTPLSAAIYADILHDAGVPAGVFNLVNGTGAEAGAALSQHPDVDMMSFTGSTRGGIAVTRDAADTVKRVTLELGGKSPNIVFADCGDDLAGRVEASVAECFLNSGQSCDAPTRMLVERPIYDTVCMLAARTAAQTVVGDPAVCGARIGPLAGRAQWDRVQSYIAGAMAQGARCIAGGSGKPDGLQIGHYARPTIFADVAPDMTIWREEVFGPVLSITPFDTEDAAIALANDTPYGLAGYIQTGDRDRALRVAGRLRAGMVHVNGTPLAGGSPFGGYRMSGNGREGGRLGLEEFLEVKTLHLPDDWR